LQDAGRFGVRHLGVTQGGAADWRSMSWANWLLGNGLDAPVIEITLGGFTVVAEEDCVLALAGADLGAQVDGEALAPWRSFRLNKGQRLQFTQPLLGARAYLAAPGGFDAPKVLGSSATVVREELGGLDGMGRALAKDAQLSYSGSSLLLLRELAPEQVPDFKLNAPLDLVPRSASSVDRVRLTRSTASGPSTAVPTGWASACWERRCSIRGSR
jgi:allophanate hydrolase subunit 2